MLLYKNSAKRDLDLKVGRFDSGVYVPSMLAKPGNEDLAMAGPLLTETFGEVPDFPVERTSSFLKKRLLAGD